MCKNRWDWENQNIWYNYWQQLVLDSADSYQYRVSTELIVTKQWYRFFSEQAWQG